jgi:DNA-binding MarR family transcriptional regulator
MNNTSSASEGLDQQPEVAGAERAADVLTIASQLRPVLLRLHRYLRNEAHELGVTSTQASLLGAIERAPEIGLVELAEREHMSAPTLVSHIDRLEAAGFVARSRTNPTDRRRVCLTVTEAGSQVVQTLRERRTAWLATRLETLSPEALAAVAAAIEPLQQLARSEA